VHAAAENQVTLDPDQLLVAPSTDKNVGLPKSTFVHIYCAFLRVVGMIAVVPDVNHAGIYELFVVGAPVDIHGVADHNHTA
jgi:hypothetical protein